MANLESDEAVSAGLTQKRGEYNLKYPSLQFYCPAMSSRNKGSTLAKANRRFLGDELVAHQMAEQNVVSAAFAASTVSRCVPDSDITRILLHVSYGMFTIHCIPTLRQLFHLAILFPARNLVRASLECIFLSYLKDM